MSAAEEVGKEEVRVLCDLSMPSCGRVRGTAGIGIQSVVKKRIRPNARPMPCRTVPCRCCCCCVCAGNKRNS